MATDSLAYKDLRGSRSGELGELRVVDGADCDLEVGASPKWRRGRRSQRSCLFDNIKGYSKDFAS